MIGNCYLHEALDACVFPWGRLDAEVVFSLRIHPGVAVLSYVATTGQSSSLARKMKV